MGIADPLHLWTHLAEVDERAVHPEVVSHEESDLHRVFCDEHFCLEQVTVED